jgi:hypothetical protein
MIDIWNNHDLSWDEKEIMHTQQLAKEKQERDDLLLAPKVFPQPIQSEIQLNKLKSQLSALDYKTSKYADGDYTAEQWAAVVNERKAVREQIRQLENEQL